MTDIIMYLHASFFSAVVLTVTQQYTRPMMIEEQRFTNASSCPVRLLAFVPQVEAHALAGVKLMNGAAVAQAGKSGWSTRIPACSGQAYFVTDGQPCNPQAFMDDILEGLGERA